MNRKNILTGVAAAMMSALLLTGCGGGDKAAAPAKDGDKGKIVVGLDDNFPPMGFKDEKNEIVGFDVDLAKEAAKRLGREVEFKAIDWSSKEAELKSGRVQILWNGLDITEKRKENMLFSDPYMDRTGHLRPQRRYCDYRRAKPRRQGNRHAERKYGGGIHRRDRLL